ncbi:MAG: nucleoside monophosphate kinase [Candidatus Yanofskybacteria bacterium]|nr:nucleoside monophosphate kinase [Candidatus Yanofskybacteria bacterium]
MKIFAVLGKSGSGKGTQVERLAKRYNLRIISSGELLRARAKVDDFAGRQIKAVLDRGGLIPTPIIFHLWLHELETIQGNSDLGGIIFEGSPRKVYEAHLLDEALGFYGLAGDFKVLYLNLSDEEAIRRLLERERHDDTQEAIQERLRWYRQEVEPVVEYYRKKGNLIEINGEQTMDEVEQEILQKLAL